MPAHHIALDSWRGLAAVLVALHHFVSTGTLTGNALVQNSWIFVDFFFLLSGFIIAANYKSNINSGGDLKNFMLLRLGRLWPLHSVMLALWFMFELAIAVLAKGATTGGRAAFTEPYDLTSLAANIFLVQSLGLNEETWNWVAWSISTEVWTYLVFGVLLLVAGRRPERAIAAVMLAAAILLLMHAVKPGTLGHAMPMTRCLYGFMAGALLHWLYANMLKGQGPATFDQSAAFSLAEVATLGLALSFILADKGPVQHLAAIPIFAPLVLVYAFDRGVVSRVLAWRPFAIIGMLSYSIYMIHPFIQLRLLKPLALLVQKITGIALFSPGPGEKVVWGTTPLSGSLLAILMLAVVIACAMLTYAWIEKPARDWMRSYVRRSRSAVSHGIGDTSCVVHKSAPQSIDSKPVAIA